MQFETIEIFDWLKRLPHSLLDLSSSGVQGPETLAELGLDLSDLPLRGENHYGYRPLKETLAQCYQVTPDQIAITPGASMGSFAAMAAIVQSSDQVVIEHPCYQPFVRVTEVLTNSEPGFFQRRSEDNYRLDPDGAQIASTKPKAIVTTNLHNPTGILDSTEPILELADRVEPWKGWLVVDEVFLPFMEGWKHLTSAGKHPRIIVLGSLTKAWGLSGLRIGWVIAPPEIIRRVELIMDYMHVNQPFLTEFLAHLILAGQTGERLLEQARERAASNWVTMQLFLASHPELIWTKPSGGIVVWVRFGDGRSAKPLCERLLTEMNTLVMPGFYFGVDDAFRLGFGADPKVIERGLAAVGTLLKDQ
jgi:hypothetical protein